MCCIAQIGIKDHRYQTLVSGTVTFERKVLSCERYERMTVSFGETVCKVEIKVPKKWNDFVQFWKEILQIWDEFTDCVKEAAKGGGDATDDSRITSLREEFFEKWKDFINPAAKEGDDATFFKRMRRIVPAAELFWCEPSDT